MQDVNRHAAVYSIGVVKNMTGLSKRQIRYYEETELVIPDRTSGNQRLYSLADVERLLRIKKLLERGMNIEEVRERLERMDERDVEQNTLSHLSRLAARSDLDANFQQDLKVLFKQNQPGGEPPSDREEEVPDRPPTEIPGDLESVYPVKNRPALMRLLTKRSDSDEEGNEDAAANS